MTSKFSLLSAALAIASFAALPALAQNAPAVSTESSIHADASKTGADAGTKTPASTDKKAKDQAQQKPQQQVAQHPSDAPKTKTDATAKTDSSSTSK
jgi:hypothetical protein